MAILTVLRERKGLDRFGFSLSGACIKVGQASSSGCMFRDGGRGGERMESHKPGATVSVEAG